MSTPQYAFLAQPPKKRRAVPAPLPAPLGTPPPVPGLQLRRRGSNTHISNWVAHVQPGSPAPRSPHRRPSISSLSSRRSSITRLNRRSSIVGRGTDGNLYHFVPTPTRTLTTPSVADFDLTIHGYGAGFVRTAKTPTTPSPHLRQHHAKTHTAATPLTAETFASIPIAPRPARRVGMRRFPSFGLLKAKKSKQPSPPASPVQAKTAAPTTRSRSASAASFQAKPEVPTISIAQRKRAKYANVKVPPTLANELELLQFIDGGSLDSQAKRVMKGEAKAAAGSRTTNDASNVGVAVIHRDENGGVWWDAEEEVEYAHLLSGREADRGEEVEWEEFEPSPVASQKPFETLARHTSTHTASSGLSDLDPKYLVPLPEDDAVPNDRVLASTTAPGLSLLSLPSRPRRRAAHLCKPSTFMVDVAAFAPRSPGYAPPKSPVLAKTPTKGMSTRRRPAPLKLASSAHTKANAKVALAAFKKAQMASPTRAHAPGLSPGGVEKAKREFLADAFVPAPKPAPAPVQRSVPTYHTQQTVVSELPPPSTGSGLRSAKLARGALRGLFTRAGN